MGIIVKKFAEDHIVEAAALFMGGYTWEREVNPLLPPHLIDDPERIMAALRPLARTGPGVSLFKDGKLIAYMVTGARFTFKGQKAALIPEFAHGAAIDMSISWASLYGQMYKELARQWWDEGIHLHLIGFLAHDQELKDILFQLGFGSFLAERIRDLSDIPVVGGPDIVRIGDPDELLPLQKEHFAFYRKSPVFLRKSLEEGELLKGLQEYNDSGDALFALRTEEGIGGFMAVGESASEGEGFLLRNTNTAQLKSAFIKPEFRGQGIGSALLARAVRWAREEGFDAIFVEHETANLFASSFWGKYFDPYLFFAMRYIDNSLPRV